MNTTRVVTSPPLTSIKNSRWRRIVTPIPAPEAESILSRLHAVEPRSMAGLPPVIWHEAEGFVVRDPYGNQWIDLTSGIVMANVGHAHPEIVAAIRSIADAKLLATYAFPQMPRLLLLEKLVALSPIPNSKAIVFSSGTEATECAMMLMRRYGQAQHKDKTGIISFRDSYHGRTLAAVLASGRPRQEDWISREEVRHYQIPFPFGPRWPWKNQQSDADGEQAFALSMKLLAEQGIQPQHIAGFMLETVPGWATLPMPMGFARRLREWARAHDVLITCDEVQSGCGRTGKMFGFEHCDLLPDLIALGKGLSSSLPVSAVVGRRDLLDDPATGEMSSTHGGNPVCAAAALASLHVLEKEGLLAASEQTGELVLDRLKAHLAPFSRQVLSVHGRGLFISIHFQSADGSPDALLSDLVVEHAIARGLMMFYTHRGYIKFTPPLCIDPEAALEAADVLGECVSTAIASRDAAPGPDGATIPKHHIRIHSLGRQENRQASF